MRRVLVPFGPGRGLGGDLTGQLVSGGGCITAISVYETTGTAAAAVHIIDGAGSNGQYLTEYTLAAGASARDRWDMHGLPFTEGVWYDVYAGAASGTVTLWADHDCEAWLRAAHVAAEATIALAAARLG